MFKNFKSIIAAKPLPHPDKDKDFYFSLLRAYIKSANHGIFVICDGMKFHVANQLLESWLGETKAALTANNQRMPITPFLETEESQKAFIHQFQKALDGQPVRFEYQISPKSSGHAGWTSA